MGLKEEIFEKVLNQTAVVFKKDPGELNADTNFTDDLQAKSVNLVQIIAVLEDTFDVEIPFMEFRRRKTIGEAAAFVGELCGV